MWLRIFTQLRHGSLSFGDLLLRILNAAKLREIVQRSDIHHETNQHRAVTLLVGGHSLNDLVGSPPLVGPIERSD